MANISLQYCLLESNSFLDIRSIIHFNTSVFSTRTSANFGSMDIKFSNIPEIEIEIEIDIDIF